MAGASAHHSTDRPCTHDDDDDDGGEHYSAHHPSAAAAVPDTGIPVVDFDALVNGAPEQRARAVRAVGRACHDWGFFMVVNHGVPEDLKQTFMDACSELFASPSSDKAAHQTLTAGPMAPVRIGSGFYSPVDDDDPTTTIDGGGGDGSGARYWRDYVKMFAHPELHCPLTPARLRETAAAYAAATRGLLLQLAAAVSDSLGLAAGRLSQALRLDDECFQILVANRYPPYEGPGGGGGGGDGDGGAVGKGKVVGVGLPAHSDHGFLTLLFQNGVDGLQVHHAGRWVLASPLPGAFFVIAGDQLEIVSNGRYRGALHRAVVGGGGERARMSVVSMIAPCLDAVVEPVPELAAANGEGLEFRGVRYRDYMEHQQSKRLDGKTALDFARVRRSSVSLALRGHTTDVS